jgi:hypothetical protein
VRSWCKVGFSRSSAARDEWWGDYPATQIKNGESRVERNVSGEGHLTVKFPPPKKRVRGIGYRFILILPYKSIDKHSSHL